jgi:hypothetical protein
MITAETDQVRTAKDKLRHVQQRHRDTKAQIDALHQAIATGEAALIDQRAAMIVNGGDVEDERHATLASTLEFNREQLLGLETEEKALALAAKQLARALDEAEERATAQAAAALEGEIVKTARELDVALSRAERINERLLALDAQLRQSGLAQAGGKRLLLLARSGAAWSALDSNHRGAVPTLLGWRDHIGSLINQA